MRLQFGAPIPGASRGMSESELHELQTVEPSPRPRRLRKVARIIGVAAACLVLGGLTGWMGLAVYYTDLHGAPPRTMRAILIVAASVGVFLLTRLRRLRFALFACLFAGVVAWYFSFRPSPELDWATDVAVLPTVTVKGDLAHFQNIRHFDYRTDADFTPRYYDKTFDITKLRSIDYILSYWAGPAIAHAFVSFGFEDDQYLAVSIETRKEKSEDYSAIQGFFRQYELIYVVADERDIIRVRTNFRGEEVYLFRLRTPLKKLRAVFLDYIRTIDSLATRPRFYNALTENCTTSILAHFRCAPPYPPASIDVLLSGYSAQYAYDTGGLDTSLPFDELKARSKINGVAHTAGQGPEFSRLIRSNLPMPPPRTDLPE